ncbi:MAG: hypothetical protein Q4E39_06765 [bacterium]|nr:hypothetical protein [bacterium]
MKDEKHQRSYQKYTIAILILLVLIVGTAYAWLVLSLKGEKTNTVIVGNLSLKLENESAGINLEDASAVSENVGMSYKPYSFELTNDGNIESTYTIYLVDDDDKIPTGTEKMKDGYVRFNLIKNGIKENSKLLTEIKSDQGRVLDSGTIQPGQTNSYDLRLWIDSNANDDYMETMFAGKIEIVAEQIKE